MNRERRERRLQRGTSAPQAKSAAGRMALVLPLAGVLVIGGIALLLHWTHPAEPPAAPPPPDAAAPARPTIGSLEALLAMTPEQLAGIDIAEANLLCATGLPGAEHLDVGRCLARLDQWADRVKQETDRHFYRFLQNSAEYKNSEGYFRVLMLVTVLQQDFGVRYNPERIRQVSFTHSQDLFLHGMVDSAGGGTCVSMPVAYTAVARRLGYPVRLVLAKGHVFCRWDAPDERFNIEATNQGLNTFEDAYYKTWPEPVTEAEIKACRYLVSLSPAEEVASFLASRGHCLLDTGRAAEARDAYAAAARLAPEDPAYASWKREAEIHLADSKAGGPGSRDLSQPPMVYRSRVSDDVDAVNAYNRRVMQDPGRPAGPANAAPAGTPRAAGTGSEPRL